MRKTFNSMETCKELKLATIHALYKLIANGELEFELSKNRNELRFNKTYIENYKNERGGYENRY